MCLDRFSPEDPTKPKFPPITYEPYLNWWYQANYDASIQSDDASRESVGIA